MKQRVVVVYKEVTEHVFAAEVEADNFDEAQQKIRGMDAEELEDVSRCNWVHDEYIETHVHRMRGKDA